MSSVKVKICGLTREEDLTIAIASGADAVGFIVGIPSSPRNLTLEKAEMLLKQIPVFISSVIVTTPKNLDWLIQVYTKLRPSAIQIHGKKQIYSSKIRGKIKDSWLIKTVYVTEDLLKNEAVEDLKFFDAVLLDSFTMGQYGGTGKVHDWSLSKQIRKALAPIPVILAGGLKPENVKEAILKVQPYAVDVASGVEATPGIKNHKKIRDFIRNAKQINLSNK